MVREWRRQAARATGISLLAPLVLLVAAALVASSGGLGALGQAADGPQLPDLGVPETDSARAGTLADADIVGVDTSEPPAVDRRSRSAERLAGRRPRPRRSARRRRRTPWT